MRSAPADTFNISSTKGQSYSNMEVHATDTIEYDSKMGIVLANIICTLNERQINREVGVQNVVTHTLNQAMKKWGERASQVH